MRRVNDKYDRVAWGEEQSFADNVYRVYRAIASHGADVTVYEQRLRELKIHERNIKDAGIDLRKDYKELKLGYIDYMGKYSVKAEAAGFEVTVGTIPDHKVKFYVAMNDKNRPSNRYLDAAVELADDRLIFFREGRFARFKTGRENKVDWVAGIDTGYFFGVWNDPDAAVMHQNGRVFFFKGDRFIGMNKWTDAERAEAMDRGQDVEGIWRNKKRSWIGKIGQNYWVGVWDDGIDAAVLCPDRRYAYFFKGDEFRRFDFANERVDTEGKIRAEFGTDWVDIDAAVLHTNGKVFFFKGEQWRRFSFKDGKWKNETTGGLTGFPRLKDRL